MPNAIIAIRRYPTALLLALALFLASLAIATGSFGRTGGGGDDEGSGFGGTGKAGEFGGSGLGGTGMPTPLVINTQDENENSDERKVEVAIQPEQDLAQPELNIEFDTTIPQAQEPSSPIIAELNSNLEERSKQLTEPAKSSLEETNISTETKQATQVAEAPSAQQIPTPAKTQEIILDAQRVVAESEKPFEAERLKSTREETSTPQIAEIQESGEHEEDEPLRLEMPERIQRPELPPMQRVRPVERISIMPPRAQPMRI